MKKKITMLFAALLACVGVAKAQTTITSLADSKDTESYVIYTNEAGLYANAEGTALTANKSGSGYDKTADASKFAFIKQNDNYYIWSVSAEKFLTMDGTFAKTATPDPVEFVTLDGDWTGRVRMRFNTSKNININNWRNSVVVDGWSYADEGTAYFVEVASEDFDMSKALEILNSSVDVTYIYKYKGVEVARKTKTQDVNSAYNAPAIAYVEFTYPDENTVSATNNTVEVTCTENLPFIASESYETAKWYVVDMHSDDSGTGEILNGTKKYVWTYDANNATSNVLLPKELSKQTKVFGDDKLWCFVGNPFDGFKIYNKAAGAGLTLNKSTDGNNLASMSDAQNSTLYTLVPGNIGGSTCFLPKGHTYYLNTQAQDGVKYLKGWTAADGGSSCRFFAPTYFVEDRLDEYLMPAGAVGAPVELTSEMSSAINAAYAAVKADAWNATAITEDVTAALEVLQASTELNEFTPGYYRILSAQAGLYANKKGLVFDSTNTNNPFRWNTVSNSNVNAIVKLSVDNEKIVLQNVNSNLYMQGVAGASNSNMTDNGHIELVSFGDAQYKLKFGNGIMHAEGHGGGTGSTGSVINFDAEKGSASAWYIVPATEVEVIINEFASICLPFDVEVEGATAYAVTATATESVTLTEKADIPAGEGAILEGNGTAKLVLATAASDWSDNLLEGTTVATEVEGKSYILANGDNGIGLYNVTLTDGKFTNGANKAYLSASKVANAAAAMFSFGRGEGTTGIETAVSGEQAVVIYDLAGRRVEKMEKGIYIVNGKKVIK